MKFNKSKNWKTYFAIVFVDTGTIKKNFIYNLQWMNKWMNAVKQQPFHSQCVHVQIDHQILSFFLSVFFDGGGGESNLFVHNTPLCSFDCIYVFYFYDYDYDHHHDHHRCVYRRKFFCSIKKKYIKFLSLSLFFIILDSRHQFISTFILFCMCSVCIF